MAAVSNRERPPRYRCPKCSRRTCSVDCVRQHKIENDCDGIRDKTAYVSMASFSGLDLLSDYRLLEETARCVCNAKRNPMVSNSRGRGRWNVNPRFAYRDRLPYHQYRLVIECRKQGTRLQIMPKAFKRRRENTTHFSTDERKFYWHIVWEFPQANASFADDEVADDCLLEAAVEKYLCPELVADPTIGQRLAFYQSAGYRGVVPLMKVERLKSAVPRYVELDFSETIAWNLEDMTIIEFPTILLVLRQHLHCYSILGEAEAEGDDKLGCGQGQGHRELSEGECSTTSDDG